VRTVIVSPVPGDPVAGGTALLNAVAGITDASQSNPWLVKVEPGVFDLDGANLAMKPWVDIEGSGEDMTRITSAAGCDQTACSNNCGGTVRGADNSELRWLTVENTGGLACSYAVYLDSVSTRFTHLTLLASGATDWPAAATGLYATGTCAPVVRNVVARAEGARWGFGLEPQLGAELLVEDTTATGIATGPDVQGGIGISTFETDVTIRRTVMLGEGGAAAGLNLGSNGNSGVAWVDHCEMTGTTNAIVVQYAQEAHVAWSALNGGPAFVDPTATLTCAAIADENTTFYPDTCP